jgi:hypothetical protein
MTMPTPMAIPTPTPMDGPTPMDVTGHSTPGHRGRGHSTGAFHPRSSLRRPGDCVVATACRVSKPVPRLWTMSSRAKTEAQVETAGAGRRRRFRSSALTATSTLEPDMVSAAISGRSTSPNAGSNTPAAIGRATVL